MRVRTLFVSFAAAALLLGGCGGESNDNDNDTPTTASGDEATSEEETASAEEEQFRQEFADGASEELPAPPETARCVGDALIDAIGYEEIAATGVTAQELIDTPTIEELGLDAGDPEPLAEAVGQCEGLFAAIAAGQGVTDEQLACAEQYATDEVMGQVFASEFTGTEPPPEALQAQADIQACLAS